MIYKVLGVVELGQAVSTNIISSFVASDFLTPSNSSQKKFLAATQYFITKSRVKRQGPRSKKGKKTCIGERSGMAPNPIRAEAITHLSARGISGQEGTGIAFGVVGLVLLLAWFMYQGCCRRRN